MSTDEKIFINSSLVIRKAFECSMFTDSVMCFLGIGAVTVHSKALQRDAFFFLDDVILYFCATSQAYHRK